jgi:hypothetical protein
MTLLPQLTQSENECFRSWLNRIDAKIGYDRRFATGSVATWRMAFNEGYSEADAIQMLVH